MLKKLNLKTFFTIVTLLIVITCAFCIVYNNLNSHTLSQINMYQEQYFKIIKRNDVLLQVYDNDEINKDLNNLSKLYKMVESQIDKNCESLRRYKEIEQQYAHNTGETTIEMNDFAQNHYNSIDKLLNDTYKIIKAKIKQEEFNKLVESEIEWLEEVKEYQKVYDKEEYGSISNLIYLNYKIDMWKFRTLLLMLYL